MLDLGSGVAGGARGWVAGRAGLWGVPLTWVWVVGFSPRSLSTQPPFATQVLTYFTCDTEVLKFIIFLSCSTLHWLLAIFIEC